MELIWEKLISDYPGNPEGLGDFYFGYHKKLFVVNERIVFIHTETWEHPVTNNRRAHILIDAFDTNSGERERSDFTSSDFGYTIDSRNWNFYLIDNCLHMYLYPCIRSEEQNKEFSYKLLRYSGGKITAEDIAGKVPLLVYDQEKIHSFGDYQLFDSGYNLCCRLTSTNEIVWKKRQRCFRSLYSNRRKKWHNFLWHKRQWGAFLRAETGNRGNSLRYK